MTFFKTLMSGLWLFHLKYYSELIMYMPFGTMTHSSLIRYEKELGLLTQ